MFFCHFSRTKSEMTRLLHIFPSGVAIPFDGPQSSIEAMFDGALTFVGAIPEVDAFVVAAKDHVGQLNALCAEHAEFFHAEARGDLVILASNDQGQEVDLDVDATLQLLERLPPV